VSFEGHRHFGRNWRTRFYGSCCPRGAPGLLASLSRSSGLLGFLNICIAPLWTTRDAHKRNTPSAGRFENYGTSLGDLGSPIFVEDGPLTTCASSPLASGQILSLAARDTGAHPVQKHAFGGSFRQIRHLFRRLCRTTRALCNLHSLAAREWPNTLTRCSRFGCVFSQTLQNVARYQQGLLPIYAPRSFVFCTEFVLDCCFFTPILSKKQH